MWVRRKNCIFAPLFINQKLRDSKTAKLWQQKLDFKDTVENQDQFLKL